MKKKWLMFFVSILLLNSASFAEQLFNGGSFVGFRPDVGTINSGLLDFYIFHEDHTASWTQSSDLSFPLNNGTVSEEIGTWKIKGNHVILTTIGVLAEPAIENGINDLEVSLWTRTTQKFKIINKKTLEVRCRVFIDVPLNENPLTAPGTLFNTSNLRFLLNKVKVNKSDLKNCN